MILATEFQSRIYDTTATYSFKCILRVQGSVAVTLILDERFFASSANLLGGTRLGLDSGIRLTTTGAFMSAWRRFEVSNSYLIPNSGGDWAKVDIMSSVESGGG